MTKRGAVVLNFIKLHMLEHRHAPTFGEICTGLKIKSSGSMSEHIDRLERDGWIVRKKRGRRSIEIVDRESAEGKFLGDQLNWQKEMTNKAHDRASKAERECHTLKVECEELKRKLIELQSKLDRSLSERTEVLGLQEARFNSKIRELIDMIFPSFAVFFKDYLMRMRFSYRRVYFELDRRRWMTDFKYLYRRQEMIGGRPCLAILKEMEKARLISVTTYYNFPDGGPKYAAEDIVMAATWTNIGRTIEHLMLPPRSERPARTLGDWPSGWDPKYFKQKK